jgi:hypothetical protein
MRWLVFAAVLISAAWFGGAVLGAGGLLLATGTAETEVHEATLCGKQLPGGDAEGRMIRTTSTRVVLALDEDWQAEFQAEATVAARALLWEASSLYRGFNIHLLPLRVERWISPNEMDSAEELLHLARNSIPRGDADIVVVLTGQQLERGDGYAEIGGRYALVSRHPGHPERDAMVLAHEIAHLFGADHGCNLPGRSGVMAEQGFEEPDLVCPCTRQTLEMNAARFHQR